MGQGQGLTLHLNVDVVFVKAQYFRGHERLIVHEGDFLAGPVRQLQLFLFDQLIKLPRKKSPQHKQVLQIKASNGLLGCKRCTGDGYEKTLGLFG